MTVTPATLTITASNQTKVYGTTFAFAGTEYTTTGLVNGNTVTGVTLNSAGSVATAAVGSYSIIPSAAVGTGLANYTISYVNGTMTVTPATLTITADNQTKVYGTTFAFAGTEYTTTGLVNGNTVTGVTLNSAGSVATAAVGSYSIIPSAAVGTGLANYTISYVNGTMTVTPATLTITADNQTKVYGTTFAFAGTEYTTTGLVNGNTVTGVTLNSAGSVATAAVGSYSIIPSAAVGTGLANYTISYVNGTMTVTPATLTITASNQTKVYGTTFAFAGTEYTTTGLVNGNTVTGVTLNSAGSVATAAVGSYSIIPSAAVGTGLANYTISYVNGTMTVTPATLTITANNQTKVYGTTFAFAGTEYTTTGLVNGNTVTGVTLNSAGSVATAAVGSYSIIPSAAVGTGLANYTISYVNGTMTVTPATLTITASNQTKVYGTTFAFAGTEYTTTGLVNGNTVTGVTLNSAGSVATAAVGSYSIIPSAAVGTGLANYTISYVNGTMTVTPATLTITASNQTKVYGTTFAFAGTEYTTTGLVNGNTVTGVTLNSAGSVATAAVGSYSIIPSAAVGTGLANYTISYVNGTMTVTPATLTITASNQTKVYGTTFAFAGTEYTTTGLVNGNTVTGVTLNSAGSVATAAVGSYSIIPSAAVGTGLANYTISYVNGTMTVTPATLTITASNQTKVYGTTFAFAGTEYTTTGLVNGNTVTGVTLNSAGSVATAAVGSYSIIPSAAVGTGLANYTISYVNGTMTVTPATLTITASNQTKVYGTTFAFAGTEYTTTGLVNGNTVTGVTLNSAGSVATAAVGSYSIIPSAAVGTGLANYTISYVNGTMTVTPATLTITADNQTKVYGTTFAFAGTEYTTTGLVNGNTVTGVTLNSAGSVATAAVGSYSIIPSAAVGTGLANYTISYVNGTMTVTPATLTITADNQTKVYGTTFAFAGTEYTTTGLVNGNTVTGVTLNSAGSVATAAVGSYSIIPSAAVGTGLANYTISYVNGTMTVTPATLTITASNQTKVYGTTFAFAGTEYTTTGLVNGNTVTGVTLNSAGSVATAAVGSYSIIPSAAVGTGLANYTISYVNGTMTVTPATLTITASNQTKVYGTTFAFAGTEYTTTGLVNGNTVTGVTLNSAGSVATAAVGSYSIIPSAAVGTGLANYTISYVNGTMTVTPATLTITADNQTKVYGSTFAFAGTEYTTTGLVNGNTVTGVTLNSAGSVATAAVGSYSIIPSAAVGTGLANYTISYVNGTMTVTPATLTITASNQTKVYGTTFAFAGTEYTTTGLVNGNTVTGVTLNSAGSVATAAVGSYSIIPSAAVGTGLANYTISYVNGTMTVTPATLTITANNQTKVYGTTFAFAGTEYTTTGLVNGNTVTGVTLNSAGSVATAAVGSYSIIPSAAVGTGLANYTISYVNGTMTVTPATLTITANNQTKVYGSTFAFAGTEYTTTGLVNGNTVTGVTLNSAGSVATAAVGSYSIIPSAAVGTGLANYTISYVNGTMTVTPATLTITADNQTKVYGTTFAFAGTEYTTTGLVNGNTVTGVTLNSAGSVATAAVGSYSIIPSAAVGTGLANYTISYVNGTMTVTPATLTITADDASKVYGIAITGVAGSTAFTSLGLQNLETIGSVTIAYGTGSLATDAVGTYIGQVTPSAAIGGTFAAANYAITYATGDIIVTPAALTITADDQTKTYGTLFTYVGTEFTSSGLLGGDAITSVTLASPGDVATATVAGSPYAITPSAAIGTGLGNYTITYIDGSLAVNPATLTITADDASKVYGIAITGAAGSTAFTSLGLQNLETIGSVTIAYGTGSLATDAVGTYIGQVTPSAAIGGTFAAANYAITYATGDIIVTPAALTITADDQTKTYGTLFTYVGTEYTSSGLLAGDAITSVTLASPGDVATATVAGSPYAITPSAAIGTGLGNYTITYIDGSLAVNPATLTITADDASKVYGIAITGAAGSTAFTSLGLQNLETIGSVTIAYGTGSLATDAVGTYIGQVTPSAAIGGTFAAANYAITYATGDIIVTPAALTITADDQTKTYGTLFTYVGTEYTSSGLLAGDAITSVTLASPGDVATATVAGSPYAITPSAAIGTGLGNYTITYIDGSLAVNPATLTITADDASKVYGTAITGAAGSTAFTSLGLQNLETIGSVTIAYGTGSLATDAVGTYIGEVTPSAAIGGTFAAANYAITYATGDIIVTPAALTITADDQTKTYGTLFTYVGTEYTSSGLLAGDAITSVTLASPGDVATATVAGSPYAITPSAAIGTGLGNYTITYIDGSLAVNPATLTITADDASKVYGIAITGAAGSTAFTSLGLQNLETIGSVTIAYGTGSLATDAVGTYVGQVTPSAVLGGTFLPANYTITYAVGDIIVTPATLTITADNASKVYGTTITGAAGSSAFTSTGLQNGETIGTVTIAYGLGSAAIDAVGTYTGSVTASLATGGTFAAANYAITYATGDIIVTPVALTITADDQTKTYGILFTYVGTEFTSSGLLGGDAITSVTLASPGDIATATVAGSPYAITPSAAIGTGLGNYTITYIDGSMTVTQAALTITASNQTKTYGTTFTFIGSEFTTSGLIGSDAVTSVTLASPGAASSATVTGSPYAITPSLATGTGLANYTITYSDGSMSVTSATLTITANNQTKTFGTLFTFTGTEFTTSALVGTDAVTGVTLTSAGAPTGATVAGSPYAIIPSLATGTGLANYTIAYVNGVLTVTPPAVTLTGSVIAQTNVNCFGAASGSVQVAGATGTVPYEYSLDGGTYQSGDTFTGLLAGNHIVTVRDATLATFDIAFTITQPSAALSGSTIVTNALCIGGSTGSVNLTAAGGTAPYSFSWSNGAVTEDISGLTAGTYSVTITDANLCNTVISSPVSEPALFTMVIDNVVQNKCFGSNNASISITLAGGTTPYLVSWTGPGGFTATTEDIQNLRAGVYTLNATDANGCTAITSTTTITQPSQITIVNNSVSDYSGFGVACNGGSNGFINTTISGGTGALSIVWSGPTGFNSTIDDITGLSAGSYIVTVTDSQGCTATQTYQITEPTVLAISAIATDASCPSVADGAINLTATGGSTPYSVLWSDGVSTEDRTAIPDGTYNVIVTDGNSCAKPLSVVVGVIGTDCLEIPDVITPNGDGKNDEWKLRYIELYPDAEVFVYNRWGELIFRTKNISANPWDGTENGKLVPTDSYHYIIHLNDGSAPRSGIITVVR